MATPIKDRYDDIPAELLRVGAHRAPAQRWRGWIGFGWAALATVVLVVGGVFGLSLLVPDLEIKIPGIDTAVNDPGTADGGDSAPAVEADPVLDPTVAISVLNGTPTSGLATEVGDLLVSQGWEGAALGAGSRANAAADDVATTQVFYSDAAHEGAVRMIIQNLGIGEAVLSNDYPASPITVLLGADYVPPAG
ncbi:LytR cell envelope-related transcriptional attenuator [Homoserinimonas aerilata]|uniref:LytR cell envelope-related transcriptional attenuator n=1 Tax=Homoserinimonas aerilata TaxID=1162970 RepID=A0A542YG34_9MICO|nr:LytR C-terminal domain-containing protein [Homoserinimonas aerilata]TQL47050.1 LytR cell envelope-related transcriptional attenuator [Homoserinimonas aerilata]